jgi:hypothetical protein
MGLGEFQADRPQPVDDPGLDIRVIGHQPLLLPRVSYTGNPTCTG